MVVVNVSALLEALIDISGELQHVLARHNLKAHEAIVALRLTRNVGLQCQAPAAVDELAALESGVDQLIDPRAGGSH